MEAIEEAWDKVDGEMLWSDRFDNDVACEKAAVREAMLAPLHQLLDGGNLNPGIHDEILEMCAAIKGLGGDDG